MNDDPIELLEPRADLFGELSHDLAGPTGDPAEPTGPNGLSGWSGRRTGTVVGLAVAAITAVLIGSSALGPLGVDLATQPTATTDAAATTAPAGTDAPVLVTGATSNGDPRMPPGAGAPTHLDPTAPPMSSMTTLVEVDQNDQSDQSDQNDQGDESDRNGQAGSPVAAQLGAPGWLLPEDSSLRLSSVWSDPQASGSSLLGSGGGRPIGFWATAGATRTTGRWLAIRVTDGQLRLRPDTEQLQLTTADGLWPATVTTEADGVLEIVVSREGAGFAPFTATGFGWTLDELTSLLASARISNTEISIPALDDPSGPLGQRRVIITTATIWNPTFPFVGTPVAGSAYIGRTPSDHVQVLVTDRSVVDQLIDAHLVRIELAPDERTSAIEARLEALAEQGRRVELYRFAPMPSMIGAGWIDDDGRHVDVMTTLSIDELVGVLERLEPATPAAWTAAATQPTAPLHPISSVIVAGSFDGPWSLSVRDGRDVSLRVDDVSRYHGRIAPSAGRLATSYAMVGRRFVILTDPTGTATSARVVHGRRVEVVRLVQISSDPTFSATPAPPTSIGAIELDPDGTYDVTWLGADGTVLAEVP